MRLVDAEFEEKHYLSMVDNPTPDVSENDRKTALAIVKAFRLASTVEERKTGRWEIYQLAELGRTWTVRCSVCHAIGFHGKTPFCCECGADMRGAES